jgi:protease-4
MLGRRTTYLEMNLRGSIVARQSPFQSSHSLLALLTMIRDARDDPHIAGIAVNTSGLQADDESLWELRRELADFKATGKHVVVFIDSASLGVYHLASVADRIVMDPEGALMLMGAVSGRGYFKGSLEKLGIGFQEIRLFEYKSAAETFSRDSLSDADRRQYGAYISDIYGVIKADILKDRGLADDAFESIINDVFLLRPKEARERGLVDSIGRWDEVKAVITGLEGGEKGFLTYGAPYQAAGMEGLGSLLPASPLVTPATGRWSEPPGIAVVYALGSTSLDSGMMARRLAKVIQNAAEDWSVRAIVLRVDSPGGDAVAADYVAEAVKAARKKKPVIVSQGAVAGSGGYWVSMYADSIVSAPFSLTGSIGVIASWFYDNGLNEKLGASVDMVQIGKHADLGVGLLFPHRNLTPEERERFDSLVMGMYGDFVRKVAEGRGKTEGEIEKIAQGRIWSGLQARDLGLVDSIGGLESAIALAREKAGIPPDQVVKIVELPPQDPFAAFSSVAARIAGAGRIPALLDPWGLAGLGGDSSDPSEVRMRDYVEFRLRHNGEPLPIMTPEGALGG